MVEAQKGEPPFSPKRFSPHTLETRAEGWRSFHWVFQMLFPNIQYAMPNNYLKVEAGKSCERKAEVNATKTKDGRESFPGRGPVLLSRTWG